MSASCRLSRWRMDRSFRGTLSPRAWDRLRRHLVGCDGCRARYDQLGQVRRVLVPGGLSFLGPDPIASLVSGVSPVRRRAPFVWAGGAMAVAIAILVIFLRPRDEFRERGLDPRFRTRPPGVTVYCIDAVDDAVIASAPAVAPPLPVPTLSCRMKDELQLAYSTPDQGPLAMIVSGESDGTTFWYAPRRPEDPPLALVPSSVDEPVAWSTRLGVKHTPGKVRLHVRFVKPTLMPAIEALSTDAVSELVVDLEVTP
jgi:hypothetical protein